MTGPGSRPCVVIFGREPVAGLVKTRLAAGIGGPAAARVYSITLEHTIEAAVESGARVVLSLAAVPSGGWKSGLGFPVEVQGKGDIGDRMAAAFEQRFSEGEDRVFERNRAIIGRRVEDCHPPKSVHIVERVVDDLQSGRRDVAEFWIQMGERFVHIRYFAVRDEEGEYLGTLEVTQDIAPMRDLEGERRLLAEMPAEGTEA